MRPLTRCLVGLAALADRLPARRKTRKPSPVLITGDLTISTPLPIYAGTILPGRIKTSDLRPDLREAIETGALTVGKIGDPQ
jgi:hypothetical protein